MRGFLMYIFAGVFIVLAMDVVPPAGLGLPVIAWPTIDQTAMPQVVNRAHKGDRLKLPVTTGRQMTPPRAPAMLIGCEPVFSALSTSAYANYPGRCAV